MQRLPNARKKESWLRLVRQRKDWNGNDLKESSSIKRKPSLPEERRMQRIGLTKKWMRLSVQDFSKKLRISRDRLD